MILFDPNHPEASQLDEPSREVLRKTIEFFETRGKQRLKQDDRDRVWYAEFLEFVRKERVFATLCTPAGEGAADAEGLDDDVEYLVF